MVHPHPSVGLEPTILHASDRTGTDANRADAGRLDAGRTAWWTLRIAAAMCFVGHGAFGLLRKEEWLPFFALVGIGADAARVLMPLVGALDVAVGLSVLVAPRRAVLLYMAVWALWTAALRPLAGMSAWELVERAGNYGVPLAMLLWCGFGRSARDWFAPVALARADAPRLPTVATTLAWTTALLLVGHGALALAGKPLLVGHLAAIGLGRTWVGALGWLEIALAVALVLRPARGLLLGAAVWKLATEALFPIAGAPLWEWIERGGSYGAPLALAALAPFLPAIRSHAMPIARRAAVVALALLALSFVPRTARAVLASAPRPVVRTQPADTTLLAQLRRGGLVLACRHAITDGGSGNPTAPDARGRERNLTDEGVAQAQRMGRAIAALGIPVGTVLSSRYYRTRETAMHAFGRVEPVDSLQQPTPAETFRSMLATPPRPGTNTVLVTHQGYLNPTFPAATHGRVEEGNCVVVRPVGATGHEVLVNMPAAGWERLGR